MYEIPASMCLDQVDFFFCTPENDKSLSKFVTMPGVGYCCYKDFSVYENQTEVELCTENTAKGIQCT